MAGQAVREHDAMQETIYFRSGILTPGCITVITVSGATTTLAKVVIDYVAGLFVGMSSDHVVFKVQSGVAFEAA